MKIVKYAKYIVFLSILGHIFILSGFRRWWKCLSSTPDFNSPFKNQFKDPNNFEGDSFEVRSKVEESNTLSKISDRARKDKKIAKNLEPTKK